jgi:DNA repair protein RadA
MVIEDDSIESDKTLDKTQTPIQNETEIEIVDLELGVDQLKGVGSVTQKKLETFGVTSLIDICIRGAQEIKEITGVAKPTCDSWVFQSQKLLEDNGLIRKSDMSTNELWEYQKAYPVIATKCDEVDNLISGGVRPEATYEVYGEFGAGKTQFCNSLTVETIHDGNNIIWIDCEDTFKPNRIAEMLKAREYAEDDEEVSEYLNQITYLYCPNTEQLMGTINGLSKILDAKKPKLVILDGAIGQFREEYLGRGTLAERQMQIARLMSHIKNISFYFRCAVVFTNQVQSDPSMMFGDPIKPIGGNVVAHASTYRLYFKKSGKKRLARMIDSPEHAMADAEYILDAKGMSNVE